MYLKAHRLQRYKQTLADHDNLRAEQGNNCAICHRDFAVYTAFQDHFHHKGCGGKTKKLCGLCNRGLLCFNCNKYCVGVIERLSIAGKKIPPTVILKSLLEYFEKWEPMMKARDEDDAKRGTKKRKKKTS